MADIIPFRGILYNSDKIDDFSKVVTPPFDVISEDEQCYFHDCHPQNMIRLILGKSDEKDTSGDNCYTRAAHCFGEWLSEDILVQDHVPAFYLESTEFTRENQTLTRFGLIALVRLEPFEKRVVLPHERTFSNVKAGRLELMKACHANLSPIFALYPDPNGILSSLKKAVLNQAPDMDFTDNKNHKHKLWRITDTRVHQHISDMMADKRIFIADGHHRYETALNYRQWATENVPGFSEDHPANYVMMYLSSMEDPGMVILPAHRMLKGVPDSAIETLIREAGHYFDITAIPYAGNGGVGRDKFISLLRAESHQHTIGVSVKNHRELYLLKLKPNVMARMFGAEMPETLLHIDVTVLTRLIFMDILGFDQARLDNETLIAYSSLAEEAIECSTLGNCDISFILNPTRIGQLREVAEKGLVMPRKATYFYPKVIAGQVMNSLRSGK